MKLLSGLKPESDAQHGSIGGIRRCNELARGLACVRTDPRAWRSVGKLSTRGGVERHLEGPADDFGHIRAETV